MTNVACSLALWALVNATCAAYALPPEPVYELIIAESGGDHLAVGDNGLALGLAQFHEGTFTWMARLYEKPYTWPEDALDEGKSLDLLCAALADGRAGHWHGWARVADTPPRTHDIWRQTTEDKLARLGVR